MPLMQGDDSGGGGGSADEFEEIINEIVDKGDNDNNNEEDEEEENIEKDVFDENASPLEDEDEEVKNEEEDEDNDEDEEEEEENNENKNERDKDTLLKEIKEEFPKLFNKFPELRSAYFRDQKYREHFATPEEAKDAVEVVESFNYVQNEIANGKADSVLEFLEKNPKALVRFGRTLINGVLKKNQEHGAAILYPSLVNIITDGEKQAKLSGNKNLENSFFHLKRWLFNSEGIPEDTFKEDSGNSNGQSEEVNKIIERTRNNFLAETRDTGLSKVQELVNSSITRLNAKPSVKRAISIDITKKLFETLNDDTAHMGRMKSLYKAADKNGYTPRDRSSIISAYLEGVKRVLPRVRIAVLKENGYKIDKVKKNKNNEPDNKGIKISESNKGDKKPVTPSARTNKSNRPKTDLDILNELV